MTFVLIIYFALWITCAITGMKAKKQIKENYPDLYSEIYAKSLTEQNIKTSLRGQKFALSPSEWSVIQDQDLLKLLRIQRFTFIGFMLILGGFFLTFFIAAIFTIFNG